MPLEPSSPHNERPPGAGAGANNDPEAVYRTTIGQLHQRLTRMLGNRQEAEDIAHDAYLRVWPEMQRDTARNPAALLYTTACRLALNRIKRRRIAPIVGHASEPDTATSRAPGVVQQVIARQELQRVEQAIAALPEGCRAVLLLRKIDLLSHQEIADRLGIAVSTVEKQHARALRLLRQALAEAERDPVADQEVTS